MGIFRTLSPEDVQGILRSFGRGGYRSHTPIAAGTINTNVRIECDCGLLFLRINEGKSVAEVEREAAIVAHAAAKGVSTPVPMAAADGRRFAVFGDAWASLFPWVAGATLRRDQVGLREAASAGKALAALHLAGRDFPDRRPGRYEPQEIVRRFTRIAGLQRADLKNATEILGPRLDELARSRAAELPMGLIHGDLFIDNVLFDGSGEVSALLDFEQASWGRLAYDVAVTALAFGFGHTDFRSDVTRAFLAAYCTVRAPAAEEVSAFGNELRFAACRFTVTRITDVFLRRTAGAPAGKDFNRYLARLDSVEKHLAQDDGLLALG